jgi:DNA repair protein RadD
MPGLEPEQVIAAYPDAVVLGLTATPCRGDGRGLGNLFEVLIECPQVAALVDQGHLVRSKVFAPSQPDLTGVRVKMGDYIDRSSPLGWIRSNSSVTSSSIA